MQVVSEPKYDEDVANKGYVDKAIGKEITETVPQITTKNYNAEPTPPYYVGDTWTQGSSGNMYRCIKQRLVGNYNASDWELAIGVTKEELNGILEKVVLLTEQVDKKIESYYQETDPSEEWETYTEKEKHLGDLWYNPTTGISKVYNKENSNYLWKTQDVPLNLYDKIDSKKSIYTEKPSSYEKNDMWIISKNDTDFPDGYSVGDMLISNTTSNVYVAEHWSKKDNYAAKDYVDKKNNEVIEKIEKEYKPSILETAQANATSLINAFNKGEFIKYNGVWYLYEGGDITTATNVWAFSSGGIGHSSNGIDGPYEVAMTMDGKINASMILVGSLLADFIRGGTLTLGGLNNTNGKFKLLDSSSNQIIEMNSEGIVLSNGAKLIGGSGVLSCFTFDTGNYNFLGFSSYDGTKQVLDISAYIPSNFVVKEAHILLEHAPMYWDASAMSGGTFWGYARNVNLYKYSNSDKYYRIGSTIGGYVESDFMNLTKIDNVFGSSGFTGKAMSGTPSASMADTVTRILSTDISGQLTSGKYNNFRIQTADSCPALKSDMIEKEVNIRTGIGKATLFVIGYIK